MTARERLFTGDVIEISRGSAVSRSRAVMERLGLTYRGETRWHDHDVVWYAVDR